MKARSGARALIVSVLALGTVPALVPGVAHATTTAVSCPGDDLQAAINVASPGDTLDVIGTCTGNFTIGKDLTLQGDGSTVLDGGGAIGAPVVNVTGTPTVHLSDLTVTGGNNAGFGGGIFIASAALTLTRVTVSGNSVTSPTASGGGILNNSGTLTVVDSTVSGNTAAGSDDGLGGGILSNGTLTMMNSTVAGNTASATGAGGLAEGGGVVSFVSTTIINTTIASNAATATGASGRADGGGIVGNMSPTATLISGNTASGPIANAPDCDANLASGGYNLVGNTSFCGGFVGTDLQNVNPKLDSLKDNAGPTQTMGLLPGSSAIDAIPLTGGGACVVGQSADQRGAPRPQGRACDIGAVEKGRTTTAVASSDTTLVFGQSVQFTATVCANPSSLPATPTGTVTFRYGGTGPALGLPISVAPGGGTHCAQAQQVLAGLAPGRYKIVGIYSGDGVNTKSRGSVIQRASA